MRLIVLLPLLLAACSAPEPSLHMCADGDGEVFMRKNKNKYGSAGDTLYDKNAFEVEVYPQDLRCREVVG